MKKTSIIILAIALGISARAQKNSARLIDWDFLSQVEFKDKYFQEYEAWYLVPVFEEPIEKLDGKKVIIKGYVIPLDVDGGKYALSAYPFSSCFFCGGAGPESVMSLKFEEEPRRYKTDEVITFTGTLHLNSNNFDDFNYVLKNAAPLEK